MNKRLVWNFEINTSMPLEWPKSTGIDQLNQRWESRFFWPDDEIVILHGLNEGLLDLSRYEVKHRQDTYCLLPNNDYNLKIRRDQLVYKPVLMKKPHAKAYGKKIKLEELLPGAPLAGCDVKDAAALIACVKEEGKKIPVEKEALIYRFNSTPMTKLELARLHVLGKTYLSVCIESTSLTCVESIGQQLLCGLQARDYVTFLKEISD